jgi:hypothetical protein
MATHRLPTPGSDNGTWGDILNDFLVQAHNSDGSLQDGIITDAKISSSAAIAKTKLAPSVQTSLTAADNAAPKPGAGVDGKIIKWNNTSGQLEDASAALNATYAPIPSRGTLAARPAATGSKSRYTATDVNGGTEYEDSASGVWSQITSGLTVKGTELAVWSTTSDTAFNVSSTLWQDVSGATITIPAGSAYRLVLDWSVAIARGTVGAGGKPNAQVRIVDVATSTVVYLYDFWQPTFSGQTSETWLSGGLHSEIPTKTALGSDTAVKLQVSLLTTANSSLGSVSLYNVFGNRATRLAAISA